jgi:N-acyl-D-aspartate/D-glutamate deacylase
VAYDLVIRNGTVVDGSGRPRYRADVGVNGGRIVTVGKVTDPGTEEIDAEGHFVTPGFVDVHTHLDAQVFWEPLGTCACWHGVTSVVMGNCGFTVAPGRASEMDLVLRSIERAEDIAREDVYAGVDWTWATFPEYLDALERAPKGVNYASYMGHSALRAHVMGERAFEGEATEDDLQVMRRELAASLRAGAVGFSTSRSPGHRTVDDGPVASRFASWTELETLAEVMGEERAGILQIANEVSADDAPRAAYFGKLRDIAVTSGRPVTFPILFLAQRPAVSDQLEALISETRAAGGRMIGQVHVRETLSVIGFPVYLPFDRLPVWQELRAKPLAAQQTALADRELRARLVDEAMHGRFAEGAGSEVRPPRYDAMRVLDRADGPTRTVADVAAERGCTAVDALIDLSLEADMQCFFAQPFANEDPERTLAILRNPDTVIAASDTGAHVSQIIDSSIPTYLLSHWVRGEEAFTWEQAIRMLTEVPASRWGFHDRGLIEEGRAADLVVLDPDDVGPEVPTVDHDLPAGGKRLVQRARGILATVVNGEVLLRDGTHTGALPGQVLRPSSAHRGAS